MRESLRNCAVARADEVKAGDIVRFDFGNNDYTVESVERTKTGMVRHQHERGSDSYFPYELLFVESQP